jgi:hypothetical protein
MLEHGDGGAIVVDQSLPLRLQLRPKVSGLLSVGSQVGHRTAS